MRVLIIDDDPARQEDFQAVFSKVYPDWDVTYVWNAKEAQEAFKLHEFDLAFFDHDLGWGSENGSWLAYEILNNPETYKPPKKVWIHTNNSVGARNIFAKFKSAGIWADVQPYDHILLRKIKDRKEFVGFYLELEDDR